MEQGRVEQELVSMPEVEETERAEGGRSPELRRVRFVVLVVPAITSPKL